MERIYDTIGIIGLGLIGGSMARTIKKHTSSRVLGYDMNQEVMSEALSEEVIDGELTKENAADCELILIGLYPRAAVEAVESLSPCLGEKNLIIDLCGVKTAVIKPLMPVIEGASFSFIGGHPMAGTERTGFGNSSSDMFDGASMILVPIKASEECILRAESFFMELGFGCTVRTSMEKHDRIIAFTSQLAHVVSNAYVKSPTAKLHEGYSAGSYLDLTRVAWLNEVMWAELFMDNREALADEVDRLVEDLKTYSRLIREGRQQELEDELREGRIRKELIDRREEAGKELRKSCKKEA